MSQAIPTLIVDDEPLARRRLHRLVHADSDIRIVATCESAADAATIAREMVPQLLFLDIRMPELDGFQLVSSLAAQGLNPYVIFVTAHPDRAMDAFAVGAVDYVLKPFDSERLGRALVRAKTLIGSMAERAVATVRPPPIASCPTRLLLSERGKLVVLSVQDIEFVQAGGRHVKIYAGGRCHVCRRSLGEIESRLGDLNFVRIHRSTLVNIQHLAEMHPLCHGDYEVVLRRGTRLPLSRRYRERLAPFILGGT